MSTRTWTFRTLPSLLPLLLLTWHSFDAYPEGESIDPEACQFSCCVTQKISTYLHTLCTLDKQAIDKLSPGDAVIIFTPDSQ